MTAQNAKPKSSVASPQPSNADTDEFSDDDEDDSDYDDGDSADEMERGYPEYEMTADDTRDLNEMSEVAERNARGEGQTQPDIEKPPAAVTRIESSVGRIRRPYNIDYPLR